MGSYHLADQMVEMMEIFLINHGCCNLLCKAEFLLYYMANHKVSHAKNKSYEEASEMIHPRPETIAMSYEQRAPYVQMSA